MNRDINDLGLIGLGLFHEIANPTTALLLGLQLVRDRLMETDDETRILLERQIQRANELHAVIRRFRDWVEHDDALLEPLSVSDVIRETLELVNTPLLSMGYALPTLRDNLPADMVAMTDRIFLQRALVCILTNAAQSTGADDQTEPVTIELSESSGKLQICVSDHGRGFEDTKKAMVVGSSSRPKGMGIGLPLAARMVDAMGGELLIEESDSAGSMVRIILPLD